MNRHVLGVVSSLWIISAGGAVAQDTSLQSVQDRPRFLMVAVAGQPPIDASDAPVLRRRVTTAMNNVPLGDALREIGRQVGVRFAVSPETVPVNRRVSLRVSEITLGAALFELLGGLGLDVQFSRNARGAAIVRRRPAAIAPHGMGNLAGRVTDASTGRGVGEAEVILERSRWHTATDSNGAYRLANVEAGDYTLVVRRVGYTKQSQKVTVRSDTEDTVDVKLEPAAVTLNELVTTATGRQRRRDLGNAITTIKADSVMEHAPVRNLTDLLENRVPGLTVQRTTGAPGDPSRLRLRGLGSALRSNDPVVVVDGVRVYAAQSEGRSGNLTNGAVGTGLGGGLPAPSPLDQIDPNTIETIEVFKGASAATLYGADAANGVIVITTKRGKPGPTRWTASLTHGRESSPGRWPTGYYRWGHDIINYTPRFCTLFDLTCAPDSLVQFQALNDPALTVFGRGHSTALSLTASGGTQALTYSVTGSYSNALGLLTLPAYEVERFQTQFSRTAPDWMRHPHQYETWGVTSHVTARLSTTADVTLSTALNRSEQQRTDLERQLAKMAGIYVDTLRGLYYLPKQAYTNNYVLTETSNILESYYTRITASTLTLTTGLSANWRPRTWFTATGQAGLNVVPRSDKRLLPSYIPIGSDSGAAARGNGRSVVSTVNLQGTLRKPLGRGFNFETNLGANVNTLSTEDLASQAIGLMPGTNGFAGARSVTAIDGAVSQSSYGWYVEPRVVGQRFSLATGLRLDGGSANGTRLTGTGAHSGSLFSLKNLLALPKLNGSWVISEEPWFPFQGLFSSLRLRGAYGQAQVQPGPADRLRLYDNTVELTTLGNTELRPERSTEFEGGFDADLLDSRVSVELTAYRKLQVDALMNVGLPGSINGGTSVVKNIGNILNRGLELGLRLTPVKRSDVTWTAQLLLSRNHNELTKLGRGVTRQPRAGLVEGYPVGSRWAKPILGFADQNGDGVVQLGEIKVGDSLVFIGRLYPAYTSVLNTSLALFGGAVGVTADFAYDAGRSQVDQTAATNWVLARALVDPSTPFSQQAAVVEYVRNAYDNGVGTDYGVMQQISTFRFNTLSVNYRAPARLARLLGAERLGVAVQGYNLALHSTYRGKDPNVNAWGAGEGIADTGQLPQPRIWQLRVDLSY